ncbi:MAG: mycofactocin-associated electron transfer flavoprotein alpha subunit [Acidimicrobiales bacterium]
MNGASAKVAVLVVRDATLPNGAAELVADATDVVLVGDGLREAFLGLPGLDAQVWGWEIGNGPLASLIPALCRSLMGLDDGAGPAVVVMSCGPDGRFIGPGLAHHLRWPFVAQAVEAEPGRATQLLPDGMRVQELAIDGPFVATLLCGTSSPIMPTSNEHHAVTLRQLLELGSIESDQPEAVLAGEVVSLGELPAVVSTMDLGDADRIIAAGAGLGESERLVLLAAVGERIGAAMGATRVLADRGWVSHRRQIGTTGVAVNPKLYLAFGISGASQHTGGLGQPQHVVSVNRDASCPMMAMADLAVVADAPEVLQELAKLLEVEVP